MTPSVSIPGTAPNIIVVDDTPASLRVLHELLRERGYKVRPMPSGALALQAARHEPPDLILLDVNMPEMDGWEVCRQLKADDRLKEIPIIFISALTETTDKVRAFQLGGVDYITKPIQLEEVDARVRTHLELRRQRHELQQNYERLQEMERLRDNLTHMIIHDMRTPLTVMGMALEFAGETVGKSDKKLAELIQTSREGAVYLNEMITQLLDISRLEIGQMPLNPAEDDLTAAVRKTVDSMATVAGTRHILVDAPEDVHAFCDGEIIRRVVLNLVGNAVKFTPADGEVRVCVAREGRSARVSVEDNGPGIPAEYHRRIFEKFGQVGRNDRKRGTGLGLTFCKLAVEAHGGSIGVDSSVGGGSTFWFTLPDKSPAC